MKKYVGTYLTEDEHKALRIHAAKEGESASSLLKRLVLNFLARKEKAK